MVVLKIRVWEFIQAKGNGLDWMSLVILYCGSLIGLVSFPGDDESEDFDPGRAEALTTAQIADGWISLFDGKSTFGWRREVAANFKVSEGAIDVGRGPVGLMRTATQFDDFELRLEFLAEDGANGGVFIRTSPRPTSPVEDCYEVNIAPASHPFPTGSLVGWRRGSEVGNDSGWRQMAIRAEGRRIQVWIDGQPVTDFALREPYLQKGFIGLQHHTGRVRYRNIILQPLGMESIFDGHSLAGWSNAGQLDCRPQVIPPDTLRLVGGRGQLESVRSYRDFIFSAQIRTNAAGVNSGVFFRCIPGELMNGYESQIDNRIEGGDRQRPVDFGTGGIFRRQQARQVNAVDGKWFTKTIVADGATTCVWVNGYQVVDWTDQRKRDANPRKGRRLEAGTIILQGHDSETDLSFRQIRARELGNRRNGMAGSAVPRRR